MSLLGTLGNIGNAIGGAISSGITWVANTFIPKTPSGNSNTSNSGGSSGNSGGSGGGSSDNSSGDNGSTNEDGSTQSNDNTTENVKRNDPEKNKTLAEIRMSEELRNTFSLIITIPQILEGIHTNQFFFLEVTDDFYDKNYPQIMEIIASKKFGRYAGFMKGRFFIDKIVQKGGVDGFGTEITLNPIAPSHGTYIKMQQDAEKALIQALNDNTTYQGTGVGGVGGSVNSSDLIGIGNELGNKYTFCGNALQGYSTAESYTAMKKAGCGSCWAWSGALYTELKAKGYTVRVIEYRVGDVGNHRSVQVNTNGTWEDFPYRQTSIHKYAWSFSHSSFTVALDENGNGATNIL